MLIRIGALADLTGVSADVLRSWERRYGLLTPTRTGGGFRLYSDGDVARVRAMLSLLAAGQSASEAARQLLQEVPDGTASVLETPLEEVRAALHRAFRGFDEVALETALDLVLARVSLDTAIRDVFVPALRTLGDDWAKGDLSVAQEHFSVNILRGRLMGLARGWDFGLGPRALLACPPNEHHDVSLVLFGLALRRRGWRITFLGMDTPLEEVWLVRDAILPRLTVLYAVNWVAQEQHFPTLQRHAGDSLALAGHTAGAAAQATGCTWLQHDPVTEADAVTRDFATAPDTRQPTRR